MQIPQNMKENPNEQDGHLRYKHSDFLLEILTGAFMDLANLPYVVQDVRSIGYPTYVL
jgi:hypothetical protein